MPFLRFLFLFLAFATIAPPSAAMSEPVLLPIPHQLHSASSTEDHWFLLDHTTLLVAEDLTTTTTSKSNRCLALAHDLLHRLDASHKLQFMLSPSLRHFPGSFCAEITSLFFFFAFFFLFFFFFFFFFADSLWKDQSWAACGVAACAKGRLRWLSDFTNGCAESWSGE